MATIEMKLPHIGEGITEAEITRWLVGVGDSVSKLQMVVEVMTDKATVEIPSDVAGTVTALKWEEGDVVPVDGVLLELDGDGAAAPAKKAEAKADPKGPDKPAAKPDPEPAAAPTPGREPAGGARQSAVTPHPRNAGGPVLAAPATRKLARELGVDLAAVRGTGGSGRVTPADVKSAAQGAPSSGGGQRPQADSAPPAAPPERVDVTARGQVTRDVEKVKITGVRRKISEAMVRSKFTAPHFTYVDEFDASKLVELRNSIKGEAAERGVKLTYLPFFFKALVHALKRFPRLNSNMHEPEGQTAELHIKRYYNFGISVATDTGLIVPVVRDVDKLTLFEIASELTRLSTDARTGKINPSDLGDTSFTVTSAGNIGGLFATPIINYPDVAILGAHVIKKRAVVLPSGELAARDMSYISMSLDHRVIDGSDAAHFVNCVIGYLQDPARLLLDAI